MATTYDPIALTNLNISTIYRELMAASTGVDSVYIKAKETLVDIYNNSSLTDQQKATFIAQSISSMVSSITSQSMDMAFKIEKENRDGVYILTKLREDTKLVTANVAKVESDILQNAEQTLLITAQTSKLAKDELHTVAETSKLGSDKLMVEAQTSKLGSDKLNVEANTLLIDEQTNKAIADTGFVATQDKVAKYNGWKIQAELKIDYGITASSLTSATDIIASNLYTSTGTKFEQMRQVQSSVYNAYATAYRQVGAITNLTIDSTGMLTSVLADADGLLYWQKEVAKRQKTGFDDNQRQHVINSTASLAAMLMSDATAASKATYAGTVIGYFGTAVNYLNSNTHTAP